MKRFFALVCSIGLLLSSPTTFAFVDSDALSESLRNIEQGLSGDSTGLGGLISELEKAAKESGAASDYLQVTISGRSVTMWDVPKSQWFYSHVLALTELGIVSGYKDTNGNPTGAYGPGDNVTREQALKIALGSAGVDETRCVGTASSQVSEWARQYSVCANQMGFGTDGKNLQEAATRAELLHYVLTAFGVNIPEGTPPFDDSKNHMYKNDIAYAYALEIVSGDKNADGTMKGTFRPDANVNRAESAKIAKLAIELL